MFDNLSLPLLCKYCLRNITMFYLEKATLPAKCCITKVNFYPFKWIDNVNVKRSTIICKKIAYLKSICQSCLRSISYLYIKNTKSLRNFVSKVRVNPLLEFADNINPDPLKKNSSGIEFSTFCLLSTNLSLKIKRKPKIITNILVNKKFNITYVQLKSPKMKKLLILKNNYFKVKLINLNVVLYYLKKQSH